MGLLEDIKEFFNVDCLYKVFGVEKDVPVSDLKKAYRKKSLLCHPDKATENDCKEQFTRKFQTVSKCYDILQDEEKRKIYDETGSVDDSSESSKDWDAYWRRLFPEISTKQIDDFLESYRDSDTEKKDLMRIYEDCKGDLNKIHPYHFCYNMEDEDRICAMLKDMIAAGDIKDYPAFSKESKAKKDKRKKFFLREEKEAKAMKTEENLSELALMIRESQKKRGEDFLASLEAKYAPKPKVRKTAKKGKAAK